MRKRLLILTLAAASALNAWGAASLGARLFLADLHLSVPMPAGWTFHSAEPGEALFERVGSPGTELEFAL